MKKSLFIIAATALIISCSSNDVKNDIDLEEVPIGFAASFMEKSTRANAGEMIIDYETAANSTFNKDENTFEVWGWRTDAYDVTQPVFDNQLVEYDADDVTTASTNWLYTPRKYWDRASSYKFYAAAPHGYFTLEEDNDVAANRKFSVQDIPAVQILHNKYGINLIDSAYTTGQGTNSTAIDYLIANIVECGTGAANQSNNTPRHQTNDKDVEFIFNHILSKLTVRVLTSDDFKLATEPNIKLTELHIILDGMAQDYAQKTAGAVTPDRTNGDTWSDAITDAITDTCFYADDATLAACGVDSLLLNDNPQIIASYFVTPTPTGATPGDATVKVQARYTIFYEDGIVENHVSEVTTVTALTSFIQNYSYVLDVKIDPQAILFDVHSVAGFTSATGIEEEVE